MTPQLFAITLSLFLFASTTFVKAEGPERSTIETFIADPFKGDPTPEHLDEHVCGRMRVEKEPIKNNYVKGQVDTLYNISKRKNNITLYKQAGKYTFVKADIGSKKVRLRDDIGVGMSVDKLSQVLPGLSDNGNGLLAYTNTRGDKLTISVKKNKVKHISIERYIE